MTIIEQLNEEVKCTLAPSKIHGVGVFALRDIKKGEQMYCFGQERQWIHIPYGQFHKLRPELRDLIKGRWPTIEKSAPFLHPNSEVWLISFMNHGDKPNYDKYNDCATQDIKKGEEITEQYGEYAYKWK